MSAYYNENNADAAAVLRVLIAEGLIAPGVVDERSIEDVRPDELAGYAQCHFFAGFGVWSLALRNSGWPDDREVWTGSCPCQPFSAAGKGDGFADERHLWPAFYHLIAQRRPASLFGEQVASKAVDAWIDLVHADLEALGYAFGSVPFPSAGVGAPHIRDRNYWVANAHGSTGGQGGENVSRRIDRGDAQPWAGLGGSGLPDGLADQHGDGLGTVPVTGLHNTEHHTEPRGGAGGLADSGSQRRIGRQGLQAGGEHVGTDAGRQQGHDGLIRIGEAGHDARPAGPTNGFWRDADWLFCRDGKWRPVEPGTFPLAHRAPARVGRLRGYGNAINAKAAQAFIEAVMEAA